MAWCADSGRQRGMTLIEMVIAMVVIAVGLAGVLLAFGTVGAGSADPVIERQLQAVAEEMLEEISLKPFAAAAHTPPAACARNTFNDVADYHGYTSSGQVCTIDGTPIPALSGYSVAVSVTSDTLAGVSGALKISVTVSRGSLSLTLVGWRTDYAS